MDEKGVSKTAFCCPGFLGLFEWVVMTFRRRNAGATYQRAMNLFFHELIRILLEVYIDDLVIKSAGFEAHLADLRVALLRLEKYNLKMNPLMCAFGVSVGRFLGFIIHGNGIELDLKKAESIKRVQELTCKCDVQKLLGKINYLHQFISNLAGKIDLFLPLVQLKHENEFIWGEEQREVFDKIKRYLTSPPVLKAPRIGKGFKLYVAAQDHMIGAVLTQEDEGKEFPVAYLSRRLVDAETMYSFIENICLALYYACTKCRHYLLTTSCIVSSQYDVIKYMLQKPILSGRLWKWAYALMEYDLTYEPIKAMKGQVVADFIMDHCVDLEGSVCLADREVWKLFFNGYVCSLGQGIRCVIVSPHGIEYELSIRLEFECTNYQAEYEALLTGLKTLAELGMLHAEVFGDSNLVVQQIKGESQCFDGRLNKYQEECIRLLNW
jgi:hypothetical protein